MLVAKPFFEQYYGYTELLLQSSVLVSYSMYLHIYMCIIYTSRMISTLLDSTLPYFCYFSPSLYFTTFHVSFAFCILKLVRLIRAKAKNKPNKQQTEHVGIHFTPRNNSMMIIVSIFCVTSHCKQNAAAFIRIIK